jgi:LuxR family transcriptional regulator, quorum-sensing system regulator BjaR1
MSEHKRLQRALDLVYRIEEAPDIETLNLWFRDVAGAFGVRHFAAVLLGRYGHPLMPRTICASSDPQWAARYYARNYFQIDPSVVALRRRTRPFAWSDVEHPEAPREVKALWHDVRANGDADGFNVPWHTVAGELGVVSLRGPHLDIDEKARPLLRLLALYYAEVGRELAQAGDDAESVCPLTPRQLECLRWAAEGKSDWDISAILGVAEGTVGRHFDNIRARLDVATRMQAVVIALRKGWLICPWGDPPMAAPR